MAKMDKTNEIYGNLTPLSPELPSRGNYFFPERKPFKKKQTLNKIRQGEIIQGVIVDTFKNEEASVSLPMGTFRAKLTAKLERGDKLFFKVDELNPSLVLKPYSIYSKQNGSYLSDSNILRILDLSNSELDKRIIKFYKRQKNLILRDSYLRLRKSFLGINRSIMEKFSFNALLKTNFWLYESNIEPDDEILSNLTYAFPDLNYLKDLLINLKNQSLKSNNKNLVDIAKKIEKFSKLDSDISELISLFSIDNNSIYENLNKYDFSDSLIKELLNCMQGVFAWNCFAYRANSPMHLYFPIPLGDDFEIAHLIIQNTDRSLMKDSDDFDFEHFDIDIADYVVSKDISIDFILLLGKGYKDYYKNIAVTLDFSMKKMKLNLLAFTIQKDDVEVDLLPEVPKSPPKNISIVV